MRFGRRYAIGLGVGVALLASLALLLELAARPTASDVRGAAGAGAGLSVVAALGAQGGDEAFARALEPRAFRFPEDHGAHDGFRTEWWYVTGNLYAAPDRAFGFQLTFFRNALSADTSIGSSAGSSAWRSQHVWMAHFALSDPARGRFRFAERFAREALGLAGVESTPFRVGLEDWELAALRPAPGALDGLGPLRLAAHDGDAQLELRLEAVKPPVLQGEGGLSQKGAEAGNASYYYSLPRLVAQGHLTLDGEAIPVHGEAWLDREWSTSALAADLAGWDWFALQLDDGEELMFYRLRRRDDSASPWSRGSLIGATGAPRTLEASSVHLVPTGHWQSPGGARYPTTWHLSVPAEGLELDLSPRLENQELAVTVRYWEGAVAVTGTRAGKPLAGHGFVEMTGYDRPADD